MGTAKRRKASANAMKREIPVSNELADLLGSTSLSRPEAVRKLWIYCRENGMLNPANKREIQFDDKLEKMMGTPTATMPQLISLLNPHFEYSRQETPQVKLEAKKEKIK